MSTHIVHIGKKGITEQVLSEIERHLKEKRKVKVRFLKSALASAGVKDRKSFAKLLESMVEADKADVRGYTVTFYRRKSSL